MLGTLILYTVPVVIVVGALYSAFRPLLVATPVGDVDVAHRIATSRDLWTQVVATTGAFLVLLVGLVGDAFLPYGAFGRDGYGLPLLGFALTIVAVVVADRVTSAPSTTDGTPSASRSRLGQVLPRGDAYGAALSLGVFLTLVLLGAVLGADDAEGVNRAVPSACSGTAGCVDDVFTGWPGTHVSATLVGFAVVALVAAVGSVYVVTGRLAHATISEGADDLLRHSSMAKLFSAVTMSTGAFAAMLASYMATGLTGATGLGVGYVVALVCTVILAVMALACLGWGVFSFFRRVRHNAIFAGSEHLHR